MAFLHSASWRCPKLPYNGEVLMITTPGRMRGWRPAAAQYSFRIAIGGQDS